jgi:hypothetical protein
MPLPLLRRVSIAALTLTGVLVLTGCQGSKTAAPERRYDDASRAERQKAADRKADQLGEKPMPIDHSRN